MALDLVVTREERFEVPHEGGLRSGASVTTAGPATSLQNRAHGVFLWRVTGVTVHCLLPCSFEPRSRPLVRYRADRHWGLVVAGSHIHMMNWPSGIKLMPGLLHEMQQKAAIGLEKGESGHGRIIPCPQTDCGYGRQDEATTLSMVV